MKIILVKTATKISEEHVMLSIENKYHFYDIRQTFVPIINVFLDTIFLPKIQIEVDSGSRIKEVVNDTLQDFCQIFSNILKAPNCRQ